MPFDWIILPHRQDDLSLEHSPSDLERFLSALGDLLAVEHQTVRIVVVGGAALTLRGYVDRTTADIDIIARSESHSILVPPTLLPPARCHRL